MNEVVIENQPILSRILTKLNNSFNGVQAYLLVGSNEEDLQKYATIFAKVLICPNNYSNNCSRCNICLRITSGNFSELSIINPINGVIKKEEIIKLKERFQTRSMEGKNQVYIMNNVENLNSSAANSLLKFLEEPDSNTIAIFTTTNLNSVINTIVSRCQIIKLNNDLPKKGMDFVKIVTKMNDEQINKILDFLFVLENNKIKAVTQFKELFLDEFETRELLKSAFMVMLLAYKDALNYSIFSKMEYFNNETGIKNISESQSVDILIKKIKFVLENIQKLEYNVNITLFISDFLIGIGEITDGKGNRN